MRPLLLAGLASLAHTVVLAQSPPRLDHVVVVVPDLDSAEARLATLGFRIKPGRLHPDNLLNAHIKFPDGTGLELMTLAGPPGDANAGDYARLLAAGPGGAYVALRPE